MEDETLREAFAVLRADHRALGERVNGHDRELTGLRRDLDSKHKENRHSIHTLNNGQQEILDAVHKIELKIARAAGYVAGAFAVVLFVYKLVDLYIPHR